MIEFRLCLVIRKYYMNSVHLYYKNELAVMLFLSSRCQFVQVLHASFRRCIRKQTDAPLQVKGNRQSLLQKGFHPWPSQHMPSHLRTELNG